MLPYIAVFIFSFTCVRVAYAKEHKKGLFVFFSALAIFLPALLSGYRDTTVGIDVELYGVRVFDHSRWVRSFYDLYSQSILNGVEICYLAMNRCVRFFSDDIFWFFFIQQVFALTVVSAACYRMRHYLNAPLLFVTYLLYYFCISMCHLRQMGAVAIVLLAFSFAIEKKWKVFCFIVAVAFFWHKSAIFLFVLLPMQKIIKDDRPIKNIYLLVLMLLGAILYMFFPLLVGFGVSHGLIDLKYMRYAAQVGNSVHKVDFLVVVLLYGFSYIKQKSFFLTNNIKALCITVCFILLCGIYNDVAQRIAYYLNFYLFINILILCNKGRLKMNRNEWIFFLLVLCQFLYLGMTSGFAKVIPYTSKSLGI